MDDWGEQTTWGVNRDSDVDIRVVGHFLGLRVVRRVDVRVGNQSLNGCLNNDWQEGQVSTVLIDECWLRLLTQRCHSRHIYFLDVGQLRGDVQRFHHLGSGDFTDAVDLGGGANQFLLSRVNGLGGPVSALTSWCSRTGLGAAFSCSQYVLLTDTSTNTGSFNGVEVDAVLVSQLAYQWGDIRDVVAGVDLGGSLRSSFFLLRFSLRSLLLWLLLLRLFLRSFFLCWCFFLRLSLWLFLLFGSSWLRVAVADARDDCSDVDGVIFVSEDFYQGACDWGWDLGINLVGGDLQ